MFHLNIHHIFVSYHHSHSFRSLFEGEAKRIPSILKYVSSDQAIAFRVNKLYKKIINEQIIAVKPKGGCFMLALILHKYYFNHQYK